MGRTESTGSLCRHFGHLIWLATSGKVVASVMVPRVRIRKNDVKALWPQSVQLVCTCEYPRRSRSMIGPSSWGSVRLGAFTSPLRSARAPLHGDIPSALRAPRAGQAMPSVRPRPNRFPDLDQHNGSAPPGDQARRHVAGARSAPTLFGPMSSGNRLRMTGCVRGAQATKVRPTMIGPRTVRTTFEIA
jgi:hypothetical protein